MLFYAAKAEEQEPKQRDWATRSRSRGRSSPIAEGVALSCAAGLMGLWVWFHGSVRTVYFYRVAAITVTFALIARLVRGVDTSGAVAGAMAAFVVAGRDIRMFWVVLAVFVVTLAATRAGVQRKQLLKMAEAKSGRSASQVMANLGVAALVLAIPGSYPAYLPALAALAELAADTTSSEIGSAFSNRTIMITTWRKAPPGTDGGISLMGTLAGIMAAVVTAGCATALGLMNSSAALLIVCSGTAGMLVDSLLGAVLERRGYLNNDLVNLLGTASAALLAWLGGNWVIG